MAKRKASVSSTESSSNDDGDGLKQEHTLPSTSKKLKKRKKQKAYNSSEEENVSDKSMKSVHKSAVDKTIIKKKVKDKSRANDSFKKELSTSYEQVMRNTSEDSGSDSELSDKSRVNQKSSSKHIIPYNIKKEVLSDDAKSNSESESDHSSKSGFVNKNINENVIIKEEVQNSSSSESEEDEAPSSIRQSRRKHSVTETPSITILQDIKLIPKTPKQKIKELYPGLERIEVSPELKLSDSDDIYLLRIPKNVDPKLLKNVEIDLESECKVDIGEKYIMTPTVKLPDPTLVISTTSKVLQFKNNIKMEKYIKSKAKPEITVPERRSVPLPDNLKKRHPLFGSDFKHKIILNERVEQKLDEAIANFLKREKKAKKKKDKKNIHVDKEATPDQDIFNLFNSHSLLANHDTIKKENSDDSAFGSSCSVDKPKSKKKEKAVVQEIEPTAEAEEVVHERKIKTPKKKKLKHDRDLLEISGIKKEIEDTGATTAEETDSVSSKKRKKKSIINSTLMSDILKTPQFNSEISTIVSDASTPVNKSKKSKRDKKMKQEIDVKKEELISELLNDVTVKLRSPKKIKKEF